MSSTAIVYKITENHSDRMRRLRAEADVAARDHTRAFVRALAELEAVAADIAVGGEAYPVGVRENARRLAPELAGIRLSVDSILAR